ncbi:hypothetical protein EOM86_00720 [Candidatus Nomurabacteria bacterium]|nr:hypothetical protein [Candidatus Nomurabacteria bacterium]
MKKIIAIALSAVLTAGSFLSGCTPGQTDVSDFSSSAVISTSETASLAQSSEDVPESQVPLS